jgi:hypothetical protein
VDFSAYLSVIGIIWLGLMAVSLFAFVDCLVRPTAAFVAAGKLTKPAWVAITAVAALALLVGGVRSFWMIPAIVASLVYLVDVRPAVRGMSGGRPPSSSSW